MLLQNLKIAYDQKLLLATEFYDEGNLLNSSAALELHPLGMSRLYRAALPTFLLSLPAATGCLVR